MSVSWGELLAYVVIFGVPLLCMFIAWVAKVWTERKEQRERLRLYQEEHCVEIEIDPATNEDKRMSHEYFRVGVAAMGTPSKPVPPPIVKVKEDETESLPVCSYCKRRHSPMPGVRPPREEKK